MTDTSFRQSYPIDFTLLDRRDQPLLYIDDLNGGTTAEPLFLVISNVSAQTIRIPGRGGEAAENNCHFQLNFRPGVLSANGQSTPVIKANDWSFGTGERPDGVRSLFLLSRADVELTPNGSLRFTVQNLTADPAGGARGTRVQLQYGEMNYQDDTIPLQGARNQHISISNHSGERVIPLYLGVVGSSQILNDGTTANTLTLRLSNVSTDTTITLNSGNGEAPASSLVLSFAEGEEQAEWALCDHDQADAIAVALDAGWDVQKPAGSASSQWILTPTGQLAIPPWGYIDIRLSNIVTAYPSGRSPVILQYNDIPGYWDGQKTTLIEKAPLVYRNDKVGIGTTQPAAALHVRGDILVEGRLGAGGASPGPKIYATGSIRAANAAGSANSLEMGHDGGSGYIDKGGQGNIDFRHGGRTSMSLTSAGRLGVGTGTPAAPLEVVGEGRFSGGLSVGGLLDARGDGGIGGKLTVTGRLGVGTASPQTNLSVVGTVRGAREQAESNYTEIGHDGSNGYLNTVGAGRLDFRHDRANRMVLTDQGRLGIGTDAPSATLHVEGAALITQGLKPHYDSGWFGVNANSNYTKTHNLGSQLLMVHMFFKEPNYGTVWAAFPETTLGYKSGCYLYMKDNNNVEIAFADSCVYRCDNSSKFQGDGDGVCFGSGEYRIFLWRIAV